MSENPLFLAHCDGYALIVRLERNISGTELNERKLCFASMVETSQGVLELATSISSDHARRMRPSEPMFPNVSELLLKSMPSISSVNDKPYSGSILRRGKLPRSSTVLSTSKRLIKSKLRSPKRLGISKRNSVYRRKG